MKRYLFVAVIEGDGMELGRKLTTLVGRLKASTEEHGKAEDAIVYPYALQSDERLDWTLDELRERLRLMFISAQGEE